MTPIVVGNRILLDPAHDANCSGCIGELNTSKAKLREATYPREKSKTRWFS